MAAPKWHHQHGVTRVVSPVWCHPCGIPLCGTIRAGWPRWHPKSATPYVPSPPCHHPRGTPLTAPPTEHPPYHLTHEAPSVWHHPCATPKSTIPYAVSPCAIPQVPPPGAAPWGARGHRECDRGQRGCPRAGGSTHREESFLEDQQGPRKADDEQGLGAEDAEEDALHAGGDEQLRHPHHALGLLTWGGAEPVGSRGGGHSAVCPHPTPLDAPCRAPWGRRCRRWHLVHPTGGCPRPHARPPPPYPASLQR